MNYKSFLGISAVAVSPLLAVAQETGGFVVGESTRLFVLQSGEVRYDDNVSFAENSKQDDLVYIFTPGLELNYDAGISKGLLTVTGQLIRYEDNRAYNEDLLSIVGEYSYQGAAHGLKAAATYREMSQAMATIRNREQAIRQNVTVASLEDIWAYSAKTKVGVGVAYDATGYPSSVYADREGVSVPVDIYFAATPKLDLSVGYRFRSTTVDELPSATQSWDSKDHFINVGAKGDFTPKLSGQVRVGYSIRDMDVGESLDRLGLMGALTYVYSPKTSFDFTASNDFSNSELGTSQEAFSLRAGGRFEFDPQWSARAGLSWQSTKYAYVATPGLTDRRKDDFFVGDVGVVYAMNEVLSFQATYIYRENSSNRRGLSFNNNILSVGASLRF